MSACLLGFSFYLQSVPSWCFSFFFFLFFFFECTCSTMDMILGLFDCNCCASYVGWCTTAPYNTRTRSTFPKTGIILLPCAYFVQFCRTCLFSPVEMQFCYGLVLWPHRHTQDFQGRGLMWKHHHHHHHHHLHRRHGHHYLSSCRYRTHTWYVPGLSILSGIIVYIPPSYINSIPWYNSTRYVLLILIVEVSAVPTRKELPGSYYGTDSSTIRILVQQEQ